MTIQYRVRPISRFIVTRFESDSQGEVCNSNSGSTQHGEFDNYDTGYAVAHALCRAEHERLGWPPADERIRYPDPDARPYGRTEIKSPNDVKALAQVGGGLRAVLK